MLQDFSAPEYFLYKLLCYEFAYEDAKARKKRKNLGQNRSEYNDLVSLRKCYQTIDHTSMFTYGNILSKQRSIYTKLQIHRINIHHFHSIAVIAEKGETATLQQ